MFLEVEAFQKQITYHWKIDDDWTFHISDPQLKLFEKTIDCVNPFISGQPNDQQNVQK